MLAFSFFLHFHINWLDKHIIALHTKNGRGPWCGPHASHNKVPLLHSWDDTTVLKVLCHMCVVYKNLEFENLFWYLLRCLIFLFYLGAFAFSLRYCLVPGGTSCFRNFCLQLSQLGRCQHCNYRVHLLTTNAHFEF